MDLASTFCRPALLNNDALDLPTMLKEMVEALVTRLPLSSAALPALSQSFLLRNRDGMRGDLRLRSTSGLAMCDLSSRGMWVLQNPSRKQKIPTPHTPTIWTPRTPFVF